MSRCILYGFSPLATEDFHFPELAIGDSDYSDLTIRRKVSFHSPLVYIGILSTGTVACVDGVLHHQESIFFQLDTKVVRMLHRRLRIDR